MLTNMKSAAHVCSKDLLSAKVSVYDATVHDSRAQVGKPLCEELANSTEKIVTSAFGGPAAWSAAQACATHRASLKGEQKGSPQQTLMVRAKKCETQGGTPEQQSLRSTLG